MDLESLWAIRDLLDHPGCRLCFNSWVLSEGHTRASDERCNYCKRMKMIIGEILRGDTTIEVRYREKDPNWNYTNVGRPARPKEFSMRPKEFC